MNVTDRLPVPSLTLSADRRSACPGLFRLAPALDGAICRVKLAGGRLSAGQAAAVAAAAARFSTAPIELTNRANFQLRAIQPEYELPLIEALVAAGLGPQPTPDDPTTCAIDDPTLLGSDDVRNVMVSPLAGRDPGAIIDIVPLADRLLATLQQQPRYHALSPKFALQLDAGESIAMLRHPHDLWLSVISADEVVIGLASCLPIAGDAATPAGDRALAAAPLSAAHDLICAALDLFLEISADLPKLTRMKQLPAEYAGAAFIDRLQQRLDVTLRRDADVASWRRIAAPQTAPLGIIAEQTADHVSLGVMPPLGRISPQQLTEIARLAQLGDGSLRLTPWQSIILPAVPRDQAATVLQALAAVGLTTDVAAPFAQMIACTGSAGCGSGLAATQEDGHRLAERLQAAGHAFPVHLSGCSKSCAAVRAEPATLVAVAPGRYDLYRREAGAASRFGRRLAEQITIDEAVALLAGLSIETTRRF